MLASIDKEKAAEEIVKVTRLGKQIANGSHSLKVIFSNNKITKNTLKSANLASEQEFKIKSDLALMQRNLQVLMQVVGGQNQGTA